VVTPEGERDAVVVIDGERIRAVLAPGEVGEGLPVEDLGEVALLPGLVDVHTHLNEPGRTEWEGFWTGTRAAAAGGFTTVVDMPLNCLPETTNVGALGVKRAAARGKAWVDFTLWGGVVNGNGGDLAALAQAGVAGFKCFLIYPGCDGLTEISAEALERAIPEITKTGLPLLVHAELAAPIDAAFSRLEREGADWRQYATYLASRPDEAELEAISLLLALCRRHRFRLHIVHLSTAKAVPMLAAAKREGLPVTVETCPHYLHGAAEEIADGATLWKCAPPIRSATNREALWQGLLSGTIDLVATDHSPCPPAMKRLNATEPGVEAGRFDEAWGGIASLSTALPVMWTECERRGIGLERLMAWMGAAPARFAGLGEEVGALANGRLASLVAFEPHTTQEVTADRLHQRHAISPYLGEQLRGVVRSTWVRGQRVFHDGAFEGDPIGREHVRSGANA
jgi:allantoinase